MRELTLKVEVEDGCLLAELGDGERVLLQCESDCDGSIPLDLREAIADCGRRESLRLSIESCLEAAHLPWEEVAGDKSLRVRVIRGKGRVGKLAERRPRVLVAWSDPQTIEYGRLTSAEAEASKILEALQYSDCKKHQVFELPNATARALERKIRSWRPQIVHFIGHADVGVVGGFLVAEAGSGKEERIYGEDFGRWLAESGVEVAVISGCCSAGLAGSVGQAVCGAGVRAVVGMREPIPDLSAMAFSRAFYASLALGGTIEDAVDEGRSAMPEWSIPVLMTEAAEFENALRHNIPEDPRPFVGRIKEREAVLTYLVREEQPVRVLAIHAMGGMGKTRLAQQVGLDAVRHFPGGVWFVDCESLTDPEQLWGAIGTSLGVEGGRTAVVEAIADLKCLLILDCLEKLAETQGLVFKLQSALPQVRFLITTRILPEGATQYTLNPMAETASERMALFEVAARQVLPDFRVTPANRKLCKEIVTLLQGVPLAIFLAAGRLRHLTLEEVCQKLRESRLAVVGPKGRVGRHDSLRIVVRDSFDLLSESSRELAMRLAVFAGGFRLSDARTVLPEIEDVDDGVLLLCDHAMLSTHGAGNLTRFRALDTVREFLDEASDALDLSLDRERFFSWALARAEEMHALTVSGKLPEGFEILKMEIGNFRSALRVGTDLDRFRYLLLRPFLEAGYLSEFSEMAASVDCSDDRRRAEVRGLQAICARRQGRYADELRLWEEKIEACRSLGDVEGVVETSIDLGLAVSRRGNWEKCLAYLASSDTDAKSCPATLQASHGSLLCLSHFHVSGVATNLVGMVRSSLLDLEPPNLFALVNITEYYCEARQYEDAIYTGGRAIKYAHEAGKFQGLSKASSLFVRIWLGKNLRSHAQEAFDLAVFAAAQGSTAFRAEVIACRPVDLEIPRVPRKKLLEEIDRRVAVLLSLLS